MFTLHTEDFRLELSLQVFEADISYPENAILRIKVVSDGFSADTTMDIDGKAFAAFAKDLLRLYRTLSGTARLEEPYGTQDYLEFEAAARGGVLVRGSLHSGGRGGYRQALSFENGFDQTFLRDFARELAAWGPSPDGSGH